MIVANLLNHVDGNGIKLNFYDRNDMSKTPIDYDKMNGYDYKDFAHRKVYMIYATDKPNELNVSLY